MDGETLLDEVEFILEVGFEIEANINGLDELDEELSLLVDEVGVEVVVVVALTELGVDNGPQLVVELETNVVVIAMPVFSGKAA